MPEVTGRILHHLIRIGRTPDYW